ncbi:hypothetical protein JXA70_07510 [candidate division KSB1 bacterium]|nr:hypothetical protein [candidate division KSB1 bacterium]
MFENLPSESTIMASVFAVVSILFCLVQIFMRQKVNFLAVCKVTVYIPLLSIVINAMTGVAQALVAISAANDMTPDITMRGIARLLSSLSFGIVLTIVLAALYAVTVAVLENTTSKG